MGESTIDSGISGHIRRTVEMLSVAQLCAMTDDKIAAMMRSSGFSDLLEDAVAHFKSHAVQRGRSLINAALSGKNTGKFLKGLELLDAYTEDFDSSFGIEFGAGANGTSQSQFKAVLDAFLANRGVPEPDQPSFNDHSG